MTAAWIAHLYTASGAVCAFVALNRVFYDRYRDAFFWLGAALVIDATDGFFARRADVAGRLPWFDGRKLDDLVDYVTFVFVPAFFIWHALLVPDRVSTFVASAMLLSSAYGFSREDAKTDDHFFTGFPSYWNIVAFYLWVLQWEPATNAVILLALATLVIVPVRYVYPSRTPVWKRPTHALGVTWAALMFVLVSQAPDVSRSLLVASFIYPAYYVLLSLALHFGRSPGRPAS